MQDDDIVMRRLPLGPSIRKAVGVTQWSGNTLSWSYFHLLADHPAYRTGQIVPAERDAMREALELAIPKGVCLTNPNIPDSMEVLIIATMGELRQIAAALARINPTASPAILDGPAIIDGPARAQVAAGDSGPLSQEN